MPNPTQQPSSLKEIVPRREQTDNGALSHKLRESRSYHFCHIEVGARSLISGKEREKTWYLETVMRANPAVYLSTAVREIICQLTWSYPPPTCTARWGEQGAIPAVPLYQGLTWHPSPGGHPVLVGGSEIQGGAFLHISLLVIFSWSRITWLYTIIGLLHVRFIAVSLKLSNTKPVLKVTVTQPSTRGIVTYMSPVEAFATQIKIFDRRKSVLDHSLLKCLIAWF